MLSVRKSRKQYIYVVPKWWPIDQQDGEQFLKQNEWSYNRNQILGAFQILNILLGGF